MTEPPTNFFRRPTVVIFLVSALIKILFGLLFVTDADRIISDPDSIGYFRLAENLRHHGVFSRSEQPPFAPDNVLTPVYPLFMAALLSLARGSLWIIPIAQGLLNSLAAVLVFKIGESMFSRRAGFFAGIFYALDLSALVHSFSLLTESLFTFLFLTANFFLMRYVQKPSVKSLIFSAALFGISTLCRPVALYYGVVAAIILFFVKRQPPKTPGQQPHSLPPALRSTLFAPRSWPSALRPVLFSLCFALTISPWFIRNKIIFDVFNLTSLQGINLLLVNVAYLKAAQESLDYATAERLLEAEADSLLVAKGLSTEKLKLIYHGRQYGYQVNDPQQARVYQTLAREKIMADPLLYIRIHLMGILPNLLDTGVRDLYHFSGKERPLLGLRALLVTDGMGAAFKKFWSRIDAGYLILYLYNLVWLLLHYALASIGIFYLWKGKNFAPLWLLLLPIVYLLLITAPSGSERFRFPAMPYLYLLSGLALARFVSRLKKPENMVDNKQEAM